MSAGDNKCAACGQWAGKGHKCPTPNGTAVLDRPTAPSVPGTVADVGRDEVNDRVAAAQRVILQAKASDAAESRDVAAMAMTGDLYNLDPSEGSLGWQDYNAAWRQQWDTDRIAGLTASTEYEGNASLEEEALPDQLTLARNRVQGYMYEQYGVAVSNEEASAVAWSALEAAGPDRALDSGNDGLRGTPEFEDRLLALAEEKAPATASRPSPFGVDLPEPDRPLSVLTPQELGALRRRVDDAVLSGRPGDFTDQEVATLRADMLPTPRELSLRMHQINGRIKRLREGGDTDSRSPRGDYAIAEMEMQDAWGQFTGTTVGRAATAEILGEHGYPGDVYASATLDRAAARRRFTLATGVAASPSWEEGYNATPPNLPYANGCDCAKFKWSGVCRHTDADMGRREAVRDAVVKGANEYWGNSDLGKAARKDGIMTGGKKPGFFRRLFG